MARPQHRILQGGRCFFVRSRPAGEILSFLPKLESATRMMGNEGPLKLDFVECPIRRSERLRIWTPPGLQAFNVFDCRLDCSRISGL